MKRIVLVLMVLYSLVALPVEAFTSAKQWEQAAEMEKHALVKGFLLGVCQGGEKIIASLPSEDIPGNELHFALELIDSRCAGATTAQTIQSGVAILDWVYEQPLLSNTPIGEILLNNMFWDLTNLSTDEMRQKLEDLGKSLSNTR